jgi:hypothetical protein
MDNSSNLTSILRAFRKCGFSLVIPETSGRVNLYVWAIKASALAHGYTWDETDNGDDEISILINKVKETGQLNFDLELNVNGKTRLVWAYAEELLQNAISMTDEQVKLGNLNRPLLMQQY